MALRTLLALNFLMFERLHQRLQRNQCISVAWPQPERLYIDDSYGNTFSMQLQMKITGQIYVHNEPRAPQDRTQGVLHPYNHSLMRLS